MVNVKVISKKEMRKLYPFGSLRDLPEGATSYSGTEVTIYLVSKKSNSRLHELYHALYSPNINLFRVGDRLDTIVSEEIKARLYTKKMKGKCPDVNSNDLKGVVESALDIGFTKSCVLGCVTEKLKILGCKQLSREERHRVWDYMGRYQESVRV